MNNIMANSNYQVFFTARERDGNYVDSEIFSPYGTRDFGMQAIEQHLKEGRRVEVEIFPTSNLGDTTLRAIVMLAE